MKFTLGNILVAHGDITRIQLKQALHRQNDSGQQLGAELISAGHASQQQIEDGLLRQRKIVAFTLAVSAGLISLVPLPVRAKPSATMAVSVTVIAYAQLRFEHQAAQLRVTAVDVARGYVEAALASRFAVQTNSRTGYLLEFYPVGHLFSAVTVGGLAQAVQFDAEGGTVVQRSPLANGPVHALSFRFVLQPDAQEGTYPWPLHMLARAL